MGGLTVSPSCQDEFYIAKWMAKVALFGVSILLKPLTQSLVGSRGHHARSPLAALGRIGVLRAGQEPPLSGPRHKKITSF